jgi:hypothetical protein
MRAMLYSFSGTARCKRIKNSKSNDICRQYLCIRLLHSISDLAPSGRRRGSAPEDQRSSTGRSWPSPRSNKRSRSGLTGIETSPRHGMN